MKPILFNTEMVKAVLEDRKTVTRRIINAPVLLKHKYPDSIKKVNDKFSFSWNSRDIIGGFEIKPPFNVGDILYVRETWNKVGEKVYYKADNTCTGCTEEGICQPKRVERHVTCDMCEYFGRVFWKPSLHMPKEAARIFLKVTNVRIERLQDVTEEQASAEGVSWLDDACYSDNGWVPTFYDPDSGGSPILVDGFQALWNSTIKKKELDKYGWDANPFVWVIEFERCEKPNEVLND